MKAAILGFGKEGKAVLRLLKKSHPRINPVILDKKFNRNYLSKLENFDIIYRSPGIPYTLREIQMAIRKGAKVSSATELFFEHAKGKIIGVTGTKGKGTTSTLIYQLLKNSGYDVYLGGNIGKPAIDLLPKLKKNSITVFELSSFQLQDLKYSPRIAVILDVFPDHLDIHQSLEEYLEAKSQIVRHQKKGDLVFYFPDNKYSKLIAEKSRAKKIPVREIFSLPKLKIPGRHNLKNAAMAVAVASHFKIPGETITKTINSYRGLIYRLQLVRIISGIRFYNDSASTNPQTTAAAIASFPHQEKIIIMGGKDKNLDYKPVAAALGQGKVKLVILFGENKLKIQGGLRGKVKTKLVGNLEEAVKIALKNAIPDNIVIFSPGAASFDMFNNYRERGREFTRIVKSLKG